MSTSDAVLVGDLSRLSLYRRELSPLTVLDLPDHALVSVFDILVDLETPVLGSTVGWIRISWVCARFRRVMLERHSLFARYYTQFPRALPVFQGRANGHPLFYCVSPSYPALLAHVRVNTRADVLRLETMRRSADLTACSRIWVDQRGDVVAFLRYFVLLARQRHLSLLEDLRISVQAEQQDAAGFMRDINHPSHRGTLHIPFLVRLHLTSCWLPIVSLRLEILNLRWKNHAHTPRAPALIIGRRLIAPNAANLVELELSDALDSPAAAVDKSSLLAGPDFPPLALPRLRRLTMSGCVYSYVQLLGALRPPPAITVSLGIDCRRVRPQSLIPAAFDGVLRRLRASMPAMNPDDMLTSPFRAAVAHDSINAIRVRIRDADVTIDVDDLVAIDVDEQLPIDVEISGWTCSADELRLGRWSNSEDIEPVVTIALQALDPDDCEWEDLMSSFVTRLGRGSILAASFDVPADFSVDYPEDWFRVFDALPAVSIVHPLFDIQRSLPYEELEAITLRIRLDDCVDFSR